MQRLLVLSDLHVTNDKDSEQGDSLISANPNASDLGNDMFDGILTCIESENIDIDWVICPGDLGHQANKSGLEYAWGKLTEIKESLEAKFLVGTAGNHDLDSRLQSGNFDPKANLQELLPKFPGISQEDCDQFFARYYCIYEHENLRILNVNSSAYHGLKTISGEEFLHGRIVTNTVNSICEDIKEKQFEINILLTHHHLIKNDHIYDNDISEMSGAGKLLKKLSDTTKSPWLVIHGHQHYPELDYGRGSFLAPIIVSAGSFSAKLSGIHATASPNQFYVVELADKSESFDGWFPCGVIKSWHWSAEGKWIESPLEHRIPYGAGFGCKINPDFAAEKVLAVLNQSTEPYITLADAYSNVQQLEYLLPADLNLLFLALEADGVKVTKARNARETTFRRASP